MIRNCRKCGALTEKKVCRKCLIENIVQRFERGSVYFKVSELKEIARYFTINPLKARLEVPEEIRVMGFQNRSARGEARRYAN